MRSQKRLAITAGKMMDMSFDTFTNVILKIFWTSNSLEISFLLIINLLVSFKHKYNL